LEVEHYESAAIRHFADAGQLKKLGKLDNAGHLIGFAAECAIKHHISTFSQESPHGHLPDFLITARKHLKQRGATGMFQLLKNDVLIGWDVNHRYFVTGATENEKLEVWFGQAKRLLAAANIKVRQ
jgi:hypothetical protein